MTRQAKQAKVEEFRKLLQEHEENTRNHHDALNALVKARKSAKRKPCFETHDARRAAAEVFGMFEQKCSHSGEALFNFWMGENYYAGGE